MRQIVLPWPAPELSPNARGHWGVKSRFTKAARNTAYWIAGLGFDPHTGDGPIPIKITFRPPDKRHRDRDNCIASCKAYMDGIADAMEVNDLRFEPTYAWGDPVKAGAVLVDLVGAA